MILQAVKDKKLISVLPLLLLILLQSLVCCGIDQDKERQEAPLITDTSIIKQKIIPGSERIDIYLPWLKDKKVAVIANHTSMIGKNHLVDSLLISGIQIKKIFCPEHGFRGDADAGEHLKNYIDKKTGLPVISLYGSNKKPKVTDLKGIDIIVFDIQDVGARFYTYISTMHYVMEACAENKITFLVLDRPNPNGFYVDGPVLQEKFTSFVGVHPVPVVHGMTVAEYAQMINGEGWLNNAIDCDLKFVLAEGYSHDQFYQIPVKPSPNLSTMEAIYLYPSLCFFEGTTISVGRGTAQPFTLFGHPSLLQGDTIFTPVSVEGASKNPPYKDTPCKGFSIINEGLKITELKKINIGWLIQAYNFYPEKGTFFNGFFNNLAGNDQLKQQVISGISEDGIRRSWEPALSEFKKMRKKYLLYTDF